LFLNVNKPQLTADLQASHVECLDNSDSHCNGAKLELIVVSDQFEGKALLARHRLVNDALKEFMPQIHALSMKTWTTEQYKANQ
jgi:stress-induced morphogen